MPPEPATSHVPTDTVAGTIAPAFSDTVGDPEVSPSVKHKASGSPDSPAVIKPSSHWVARKLDDEYRSKG